MYEKSISRIAGDTIITHHSVPMRGILDTSQSDGSYGTLIVDEGFKRAVFDAIKTDEMTYDDSHAHISVFNTEEMEQMELPLEEGGRSFTYHLEAIEECDPDGWDEMEKVWFIRVSSPDLEDLRTKYGLEPLLNGHNFHITVALKPAKE